MNSKEYFDFFFSEQFVNTIVSVFAKEENVSEEEFHEDFFNHFYDAKGDFDSFDLVEALNEMEPWASEGIFCAGAEKLVFVPSKEDFVVKVLWDEELDNCYETEIFEKAKEKHLENFFLEAWGDEEVVFSEELEVKFKVYFQSKISPSLVDRLQNVRVKDYSCVPPVRYSHSLKKKYFLNNSRSFFRALSKFNLSEEEKLLHFLVANNINDLHGDNWFVINQQLKIIDYSGYPDSSY